MPLNRLMVPMVTTIEGRPKPVTKTALNAPQATPVRRPVITNVVVDTSSCAIAPIAVEASAIIEATLRSISPAIINNAIAKAIIAFSVKLNVASLRFQAFKKCGEAKEFAMKIPIATAKSSVSQLLICVRNGFCNRSGMSRACVIILGPPLI